MSLELPVSDTPVGSPESTVVVRGARCAPQTRPWLKYLAQGLLVAVLAAASYFACSRFVLQSVQVVGRSMMPTLHDSERCLLNRWIYHFRSPRVGDIVVLRDPRDDSLAVKRVIATSGDSVYLSDGHLRVNNHVVQEPYLRPGMPTYPYLNLKEQRFKCGPDQYVVMGDNRTDSRDSRTYGLVSGRAILGLLVQ